MARMKFICDAERCIECNGCVTACKNENEVPWGVNRRRVVTINDGIIGAEKSISVACMHCADAPCMAVCPVDCFYRPMRVLFCITKIPASVAPIARMPAHLVHLSSQALEPLDCAARWTSAHSAVAVLRKTVALLSLRSMAAIVWQKVNCHCVLSSALPRH